MHINLFTLTGAWNRDSLQNNPDPSGCTVVLSDTGRI